MALQTVKQASALDHSSDMVELAKERTKQAVSQGRVEIVQGDAECLPWSDHTFICIATANMFFFIEHPLKVLNEIYRVLKPAGRLVIATAAKRKLMNLFSPWSIYFQLYTGAEMESMLRRTGFETVEPKSPDGFHQICHAQKS